MAPGDPVQRLSLSLGAVSNSDVGGHGFPLFSVPCSFDDLDFTDFQQLAEAFHEVQPWSSSASLALNFPSEQNQSGANEFPGTYHEKAWT